MDKDRMSQSAKPISMNHGNVFVAKQQVKGLSKQIPLVAQIYTGEAFLLSIYNPPFRISRHGCCFFFFFFHYPPRNST